MLSAYFYTSHSFFNRFEWLFNEMQDLTYITDLVNMNGCKAFTPPRFIRCSTKNIMGKKKFYNATEPGNKSSRFITFEEWNPKVFLKIFKTETNILLTNATSLVQHQNFKSTWIPSSVRSEAVYFISMYAAVTVQLDDAFIWQQSHYLL